MALHLWILSSYSFSIVAETLSALEQHAFLLSRSWRSGDLKSRGGRPAFLPEEFSGDGLFPGLSQLPEAPSSIVAVSLFNPLSLHAKHRPKGPFHGWSKGRVILVFSFPFFFGGYKETERTLPFPAQGARPWQLQSSWLCANVSLRSLLFP